MDKLVGGGRRRGRRSPNHLRAGDPLDFWRVLVADPAARRLLLHAEMKLPGEAWVQFRILDNPAGSHALEQLAAYRPQGLLGLLGHLYWYAVLPFHGIIFKGMVTLRAIACQPICLLPRSYRLPSGGPGLFAYGQAPSPLCSAAAPATTEAAIRRAVAAPGAAQAPGVAQ